MASGKDWQVDLLIVGSGAAGLAAAATAKQLQLKTLLIEKTDKVGGTTCYSGGAIWMPQNPVSKKAGLEDDYEDAKRYLVERLEKHGEVGPESSPERIDAFLQRGPQMVDFFRACGFGWKQSPIPDYYSEVEGAMKQGCRTLDPAPFDAAVLGDWAHHLRRPKRPGPVAYFHEHAAITQSRASMLGLVHATWISLRDWMRRKVMTEPVYMGCSLVAQLLHICLAKKGVDLHIWRHAALKGLVIEDGSVQGAVVEKADRQLLNVRARCGVLLASGGFARCDDLRKKHLPGTTGQWSLAQPECDAGDAFRVGEIVNVATSLMNEAWWIPTMIDPGSGDLAPALFELGKPHCIVVDGRGSRIFSEADPYGDTGRSLHNLRGDNAWLIVDGAYRKRYTLGTLGPGAAPVEGLETGHFHKADTLEELSRRIEADGLTATVQKWNAMCEDGKDTDFGKGQTEYHRFIGDRCAGQPSMGTISKPPFYAIALKPGDAGTKGGLVTDEHARVLDQGGRAIAGLYAAGDSTASIMGCASPAAGAALGPAMTFAYIAVLHMLGRSPK